MLCSGLRFGDMFVIDSGFNDAAEVSHINFCTRLLGPAIYGEPTWKAWMSGFWLLSVTSVCVSISAILELSEWVEGGSKFNSTHADWWKRLIQFITKSCEGWTILLCLVSDDPIKKVSGKRGGKHQEKIYNVSCLFSLYYRSHIQWDTE